MGVKEYFKLYAVAVFVFFIVDLLWLGVIAKGIYRKYLGHLMRPSPLWAVAIIFYLLFNVGLVVFVVAPAVQKASFSYALLMGSFFGFITYMTYELTNWAVIKEWPWQIVIIDIIWGIVLSAAVGSGAYWLGRKLL